MSRSIITSVIKTFLDDPKPEVLAIAGKWGVGKTYTLQEIVRNYSGTTSLKKYSYVSAFGAKSIGDLRSLLLVKSRPFPITTRNKLVEKKADRWFAKGRGRAISETIREAISHTPYVGKQVTILLETIAASLVTETIICIDDVERLNAAISTDELMGLVSELKTESNCKVILLFNEEQLGTRSADFIKSSEKVVDKKLAFSISPEEAIELALPSTVPLREPAIASIAVLGISNIRTIQKISAGLALIAGQVESNSDAVRKQAAVAVVIFAGALYESAAGFPTIDQVVEFNWYSSMMRVHDGANAVSDSWRDKFHQAGFLTCDDFDRAVLQILRNGYVEGSDLALHARALDQVSNRERLDKTFTEAWQKFHNRIDGTAQEIVERLTDAVNEAAPVISPINLNGTVKLMRELGFDENANAIIDIYVAAHRDHTELLGLNSPSDLDVDDDVLRAKFANAIAEEEGPVNLDLVAAELLLDRRWDARSQRALLNATPEDIVQLLRNFQGPQLGQLVDALYRSSASRGADTAPIAVTLDRALDLIESESELNLARVKRLRRRP
jgi:hypothetical protein